MAAVQKIGKIGSKRCPEDWQPDVRLFEFGRSEGLSDMETARQLRLMKLHEFKTPRKEWGRTFQQWLITASGGRHGDGSSSAGRGASNRQQAAAAARKDGWLSDPDFLESVRKRGAVRSADAPSFEGDLFGMPSIHEAGGRGRRSGEP
jgi:hypothetical protein